MLADTTLLPSACGVDWGWSCHVKSSGATAAAASMLEDPRRRHRPRMLGVRRILQRAQSPEQSVVTRDCPDRAGERQC